MANLKMQTINKIYPNGFQAVYDFNMDIKHGEFIVLVGPSGCGKSTMLRMIAGLETISNGELILGDKVINKVAPADRDIAMVFQNYALYGNMTVYENMGFSLTVRHVNGDTIHEKVMETADLVEMRPQLNRKPKKLSGGQRQRVALGRAIARDASVFLMDEPLSNLDAKLRTHMRKELVLLHEELGSTFIYVTHDQTEAMAMADRIVVMNKGVVQQIGSPTDVYDTPENIFVSTFIGSPSLNLIKGRVTGNKFTVSGHTLTITDNQMKYMKAYDNKEVILGIRPEDFHTTVCLTDDHIKAQVSIAEYLGSEYHITFAALGRTDLKAKINSNEVLDDPRGQIEMCIDMGKVHFFDAMTEVRIR